MLHCCLVGSIDTRLTGMAMAQYSDLAPDWLSVTVLNVVCSGLGEVLNVLLTHRCIDQGNKISCNVT